MTYDEYQERNDVLIKQIHAIRQEQEKLKTRYIEENAPLKIGDKIRINQDEGVISGIEIINGDFLYSWVKFKKNGELSLISQIIKSTTSIKKL